MSYRIESFLCNYLQRTYFSILDQHYDWHVCFVMNQKTLTTDNKDESICSVLKDYLMEKAISVLTIISAGVEGAPAMF